MGSCVARTWVAGKGCPESLRSIHLSRVQSCRKKKKMNNGRKYVRRLTSGKVRGEKCVCVRVRIKTDL